MLAAGGGKGRKMTSERVAWGGGKEDEEGGDREAIASVDAADIHLTAQTGEHDT